eukprot:COSAG02_NODE_6506_length_3532_cov_2.090009_4_plen_682_part_01
MENGDAVASGVQCWETVGSGCLGIRAAEEERERVVGEGCLWGGGSIHAGAEWRNSMEGAPSEGVPPLAEYGTIPAEPEPQPVDQSWAAEPEPEPEAEPALDTIRLSPPSRTGPRGDADRTPSILRPRPTDLLGLLDTKIKLFLDEVGIGSPGPEGATSDRVFDAAPLVEFAASRGMEAEEPDFIYKAYVSHKLRTAEHGLHDSFRDTGTLDLFPLFGSTSDCMSQQEPPPLALSICIRAMCTAGGVTDESAEAIVDEIVCSVRHVREQWKVTDLSGDWKGALDWERFEQEPGEHGVPAHSIWLPFSATDCHTINALQQGQELQFGAATLKLISRAKGKAEASFHNPGTVERIRARAVGSPQMTVADAVAWHAASEGNRNLLQAALIEGADRDFRWPSDDRGTLLHAACRCHSVSCVRLLLDPLSELEQLSWTQLRQLAIKCGVRDAKRRQWEQWKTDDADSSALEMFQQSIINQLLPTRAPANHHLLNSNRETAFQVAGLERDMSIAGGGPGVWKVSDDSTGPGLAYLHASLKELIDLLEREALEEHDKAQVKRHFIERDNGAELLVGWEVSLTRAQDEQEVSAIVYDKKEPSFLNGIFNGSWENRVAIFDSSFEPDKVLRMDFKRLKVEYSGFELRRRLPAAELDSVIAQIDRFRNPQGIENGDLEHRKRASTMGSLRFLP